MEAGKAERSGCSKTRTIAGLWRGAPGFWEDLSASRSLCSHLLEVLLWNLFFSYQLKITWFFWIIKLIQFHVEKNQKTQIRKKKEIIPSSKPLFRNDSEYFGVFPSSLLIYPSINSNKFVAILFIYFQPFPSLPLSLNNLETKLLITVLCSVI